MSQGDGSASSQAGSASPRIAPGIAAQFRDADDPARLAPGNGASGAVGALGARPIARHVPARRQDVTPRLFLAAITAPGRALDQVGERDDRSLLQTLHRRFRSTAFA